MSSRAPVLSLITSTINNNASTKNPLPAIIYTINFTKREIYFPDRKKPFRNFNKEQLIGPL
jgi:hypothetical protein